MTHNLVSRQFISTSKRSNFENCTKSAQSTGPERNRRLGEKNENPAGPWYTGQIRNGRQYWACLLINELGEHASSAVVAEREQLGSNLLRVASSSPASPSVVPLGSIADCRRRPVTSAFSLIPTSPDK